MQTTLLGHGAGLRAPHYDTFLEQRPTSIDWLEIISDNYLNAHEGYWQMLTDLRQDYPIVMHGVSLSIGSTDPLDEDYISKLKKLADTIEAPWVSDHLCYTGVRREYSHDLLPIPLTQEALEHLIPRIHHLQERMQRSFVFENASSYLEFDGDSMSEPEFLTALHQATGCRILLDINNVHVSAYNHGWNAQAYIDAIPSDAIAQYHLAGHTNKDTHLIDTHDAPVIDAVWDLYRYTLSHHGQRSVMIEWDAAIPPFERLEQEVLRAKEQTNAALKMKESA